MLSREQFLDLVALETKICKHLNDKLSGDQLTYRPADGMRSTLELLQYLTWCAEGPVQAMLEDDWAAVRGRAEQAKAVTASSFGEYMDRQLATVRTLVEDLPEADLTGREVSLPGGLRLPLGHALAWSPLRFLTAYRMQLFVYAKASGSRALGTANCWLGSDPPQDG